jgi:hypothetical protein
MDESKFKKLALWQQRSAQIECKFERYFEALQLFGDDDNFEVFTDGSVGVIDHNAVQTFEQGAGYEYSPRYWAERDNFVAENGRWF